MIKVNVSKDNKKISISGHALYDKYGKDIVCAAVSSTVLTTVNACLSIDSSSLKVEEKNEFMIERLDENEIIIKLLNNMLNMLEELEKDYSKYIKINREG